MKPTWRPRGLSKSVISRVIIGVTPFRVLITLLITHLLSPLGLQVNPLRNVQKGVMQMVLPQGPSRLPFRDLSGAESASLEQTLRAEHLLDPIFSSAYSTLAV